MRPASHLMSSSILENVSWQAILLLTPLIILTNISLSGAQSFLENITIEKGGRVWIEGKAGMINYQCNAKQLSGVANINKPNNLPRNISEDVSNIGISVSLPVRALSCGKRAMDNDMYDALKSDTYPYISYKLLNAQLSEEKNDTTGWVDIQTEGIMEIAGVQDTTTFMVQGKLLNENRFRLKGSKQIHMDTYNIKPPSAMLGLIKADKDLTVLFDVIVRLNNPKES